MHYYLELSLLLIGAYLLGSVCFAILFARLFCRRDPRRYGSGNPGASNMLRVAGRWPAALSLLCDMGKAFIPVFILSTLSYPAVALLVALAIFLGHLFPLYHRFRGGKGVAVYLGTYLAAWPELGLIILGFWLLLAALSNYASVAGMGASIVACLLVVFTRPADGIAWFVAIVIMILVVVRHRDNMHNLMRGRESTLFKKRR